MAIRIAVWRRCLRFAVGPYLAVILLCGCGRTEQKPEEKQVASARSPSPAPSSPSVQPKKQDPSGQAIDKKENPPLKQGDGKETGQPSVPVKTERLFKGRPASHWITQLKNRDIDVREEALAALATMTTEPGVIPALIAKMDNEDGPEIKQILVKQPAREVAPFLIKHLEKNLGDSPAGYRSQVFAAELLGVQLVDEAIPVLIATLNRKESGELQVRAAAALGAFGPRAKAALPILEKRQATRPNEALERALRQAVAKINGRPF